MTKQIKRVNNNKHFREETLIFNHKGYTVEVVYIYHPQECTNVWKASNDWEMNDYIDVTEVYVYDGKGCIVDGDVIDLDVIKKEITKEKSFWDDTSF